MKKKLFAVALLAASFSAGAADTMLKFPIAGAMAANNAQSRLGDSVKFYFAGQPTPPMASTANAVVNIVSNFNNVEMASATEFECAEGAIMAGVALKGDFVKIAP